MSRQNQEATAKPKSHDETKNHGKGKTAATQNRHSKMKNSLQNKIATTKQSKKTNGKLKKPRQNEKAAAKLKRHGKTKKSRGKIKKHVLTQSLEFYPRIFRNI